MNSHLNLFRFYNDSEHQDIIENNLSRAFAICLSNDALFFSHYIQSIVSDEDYDYLFSVYTNNAGYSIDIQQDMSSLNIEGIRKVYAVAMTADANLNMSDFLSQPYLEDKTHHITDVCILIKDIAVVIEVKRTLEDCKTQLYNQVYPFIKAASKPEILAINYSWPHVVAIMEKVLTLQTFSKQPAVFVDSFLSLSQTRYPEWFPSKPFAVLPFCSIDNSPEYIPLVKRLRQCIGQSGYELLSYYDRIAISVPFGWANEVQPVFKTAQDDRKEYLMFYTWPGNTVGQGYSIYSKPMDWLQKKDLIVDGKNYALDIAYNIKFSHFTKFVSGFTFYPEDLKGPILHTPDNFYKKSGQWKKPLWDQFEIFMDEYFPPELDWREKSQWDKKFKDSNRSNFVCALGFEVILYMPYAELAATDKRQEDMIFMGSKLAQVLNALKTLI